MAYYYNPLVKNYDELAKQAALNGDYVKAAKLEQSWNAQQRDNDNYGGQTTNWAQYLDDNYTHRGTYNDAGVSAGSSDLISQYKDMWLKGHSLGDQEMMDLAHSLAESERSKYGYSGGIDGSEYIELSQNYGNGGFSFPSAPTYTDQYKTDIDALLNEILNRDDFSYAEAPTYTDKYTTQIQQLLGEIQNRDQFAYDVNTDPLYAQYAQQYTQQGQRSMKDTLGQIAAQTGGMASSYAASAAQQANDYYMGQLANKVPELQQLAYGMYMDDLNADVNELALLQGQSNIDYNRFRDSLNDWSNDRAMAYQQYLDAIDNKVRDMGLMQQMSDTQYDRYRDTMSDWRNDRDFAYGVYRDDISDSRYDSETSYGQALNNAELLGSMGDFSGYKELGMSDEQISAMENAYQQSQKPKEEEYKPTLTWAQVKAEIEDGNTNDTILKAYEYYMGESYYGPGYKADGNLKVENSGVYDTISYLKQHGRSDEEIFRMLDEDMNLSDEDLEKIIEYFNLQ